MNDIQTKIKLFVRLDTSAEMDAKLFGLAISDYERGFFSAHMSVIRGVLLGVQSEADNIGDPDRLEEVVNARIRPEHVREYSKVLSEMFSDDSRSIVSDLVRRTKRGEVLS